MRRIAIYFAVLSFLLCSCKSEFEKIRTSTDIDKMYASAVQYYDKEEYQRAQTLFEILINSFRGRKESEDIYFKYAYTFYFLGNYTMAAHYFKNFATTYSASPKKEEADFMVAYSNYQLSPTFRLDQSNTEKAIDEFQLFINTHPESERVAECNKLIDEMRAKMELKVFDEGMLYFNLREYQSAMHTFENMLKDFPETGDSEKIRYMILKAGFLLSENSIVDKQLERYTDVKDKSEEFMDRYTQSPYIGEIQTYYQTSDKKIKQLKDAGY